MTFYKITHILNVDETHKLYGNQWYTCTHTKTMYNVCTHNSLPTSAILALGLLKKKERRLKKKKDDD